MMMDYHENRKGDPIMLFDELNLIIPARRTEVLLKEVALSSEKKNLSKKFISIGSITVAFIHHN